MAAVVLLVSALTLATALVPREPASGHPPEEGYLARTLPAGAWATLPGDGACARAVHRSTWEPRPGNALPNHTPPDAELVRRSLSSRPRATDGSYDPRWDSWLLARVTGAHTGTTDENIQWAACKWGISDNLLRAIAVVESQWDQRSVDSAGRCVEKHGCGDLFGEPSSESVTYCREIARFGYDYQRDYRTGQCPKTFSIVGVMSWEDPAWGPMRGNQNGTFPFNRDSTAFALDYLGAFLRGCLEGWARWLPGRSGTGGADPLDGCVGAWFSGSWNDAAARAYVGRVHRAAAGHVWLQLG